eukprot:1300011-Karenia_brevis.AAC.1
MPWRRSSSRSTSASKGHNWACKLCGYTQNLFHWQRCHSCKGRLGAEPATEEQFARPFVDPRYARSEGSGSSSVGEK